MENMINKQVEEFQVSAFCKGEFLDVTQEDLKGHWSILFFYPADFTFVCPTELGDLADHYEEFKEEGCEIYSVSEDTHFVHKAWADASDTIKKIQYVMLGDPAGVLAKQFGVLVPVIVRPNQNGGYEVIAGHRRKRASELAGCPDIPVIVRELTDDESVIAMVDSVRP